MMILRKLLMTGAVAWLAFPLSAGVSAKAPSLENLRINGFMMYDENRSEDVKGFYEYSVTAPIARRPLVYVARQYVGGDAVVKDGKLYSCHVDQQYGYVNSAFYTVIDVLTGEAQKGSNISYDMSVAMAHAASSAAVNPVTGEVYCSSYTYNADDKSLTPTLKTWDLEKNTKSSVGDMEAKLAVMAFDKDGKLYGITACSTQGSDDGGRLVSVNTATGKLTLIGDTGIRPWFDQSGVINPNNGLLYWFVNEPIEGGDANAARAELVTVDLATAKATSIGTLPNGDEVVAAWIPEQTIADEAPGVVTSISASFDKGNLKGSVNFTLPSSSYAGIALTGEQHWSVKDGDMVLASGDGEPGEMISAPVEVQKSGEYTFSVVASNASGEGVVTDLTAYIGYGVPQSPTGVTFAIVEDRNEISWNHSTALVGGGYMEGEHADYRIVRQPGNIVLEEKWSGDSYSEPALTGALQSTYYEIIPVNGDVEGSAAKSNAMVTGSSLLLPYSEDFTEESAFALYTAIDSNNDGNTWYYSVKSAKIRQATSGSQDDWLVLPPVLLESGKSYEFKFNCYGLQVSNVNVFDVAMGTSPTELNIALLNDVEVKDTKSTAMKEVAITLKPAETATYRLGIHLKSEARQGTFSVDDITISAGESTAVPGAPAFEVKAGEKGALSAVLSFTIPTETAGGEELDVLPTAFEITRDGVELATVETNETDSDYIYTDDSVEKAGVYTYAVKAVNAGGKGEEAVKSVYIGVDTPSVPTGFVANDNFDGTVSLNWDAASETGLNGGYVDIDNLRYTISHPDGTKISGITGSCHTVDIENTGDQKEVTYSLAVHYADSEPAATHTVVSNRLIAGAAYKDGFAESFPIVDEVVVPSTAIWTKEIVEGKTSVFSMAMRSDDHTGDGSGCLHYTGYAADASGRWISPVIDLSEMQKPEVSIWVKTADNNSVFELQVSKEYGEWITIATPDCVGEWTEVKESLEDFVSKHVRLGMLVSSKSNMNFTYADDIKVYETAISGVSAVGADNDADTEIYDIQGVRVSGSLAPGVYIVHKGNDVRKVLIR
ncbi:MAG: choice-of-anchor J domain-containing protein [Muribaculaceae bacterium]|nr:choice-of-anchor J domain-containing protein [Muribaculaceae bacterium]